MSLATAIDLAERIVAHPERPTHGRRRRRNTPLHVGLGRFEQLNMYLAHMENIEGITPATIWPRLRIFLAELMLGHHDRDYWSEGATGDGRFRV